MSIALMLVVALLAPLGVPQLAQAKSSATLRRELAAKRKAASEAAKTLASLRDQVTNALQESQDADTALDDARDALQTTNETIAELSAQIDQNQATLDSRAVEMYRSGGMDMLEALLSVRTLDELFTSVDLFGHIQDADGELVAGLSATRDRIESLQQEQSLREAELISLRQRADARRNTLNLAVAAQQQVMDSLNADVRKLVRGVEQAAADEAAAAAAAGTDVGGTAPKLPYDPNLIISERAFSAADSMDAAAIQAFLSKQGSYLRSYSTRDHTGVVKTAAQMIADAASAWGVSPKVILVTLQKEQSLVTAHSPSRRALDWAMGCGKMDGSTLSQYQGFGNQIWGGTRALKRNRSYYHKGMSLTIDHAPVYPANAATLTLYRYTPHFHGNTMFWKLYWRWFGDPTAG